MMNDELQMKFWSVRDPQEPLGYARWGNFLTGIQRAIESFKTTGYEPGHYFRGVTKLITRGIWESFFNPDFNCGEFATIKPIKFDGLGIPCLIPHHE